MTTSRRRLAPRNLFLQAWRALDGPRLDEEVRFAPPRLFRFDFADIGQKIAVEIDGGNFAGGRHQRASGIEHDDEKFNLAATLGWRVWRFTTVMLREDPVGNLTPLIATLKRIETPR